MPTAETSVTVICSNPFHRGPEGGPRFSYDPGLGAAAVAVPEEKARELVEEHDGYHCPQLDVVQEAEKDEDPEEGNADASSSKLDRAPMPAGTQHQAERESEANPSEGKAEAEGDEEAGEDAPPALIDVKGVGEKTLPDFNDAGIETAGDLAEANAEELAEKIGHSVSVVEKLQTAAAELLDA